jgi:mRNA-degrading endonuclease toxin of MazEF toxin-antitoxin module
MSKRDDYKRGHIYMFSLPVQRLEELTDNKPRNRNGVEQHGSHMGLVLSDDEWNSINGRGIIIAPLTSAEDANGKTKKQEPTWVRVRVDDKPAYVLCEQIRYLDQSRWMGSDHGALLPQEFNWVISKLKKFGVEEMPA